MSNNHGYRPTNPKIDIYVKGVYMCSTNWSKTCREARLRYHSKHLEVELSDIKCKKA